MTPVILTRTTYAAVYRMLNRGGEISAPRTAMFAKELFFLLVEQRRKGIMP